MRIYCGDFREPSDERVFFFFFSFFSGFWVSLCEFCLGLQPKKAAAEENR
jgi:hypothetical protein